MSTPRLVVALDPACDCAGCKATWWESVVRSATRAEILEALGGEEVWWCEEHWASSVSMTPNGRCWRAIARGFEELAGYKVEPAGDCRMVPKRLVEVSE